MYMDTKALCCYGNMLQVKKGYKMLMQQQNGTLPMRAA